MNDQTDARPVAKVSEGQGRLVSLDAFRGLTMFLLVAEGTHIYLALLRAVEPGSFWAGVVRQFTHHPWNGLHFWDLVQPYFMFIAGVAMPFSLGRRREKGQSSTRIFFHVLQRCVLLFLFGTGLHCIYNGRVVWELWNVLTQLSVTYFIAYLFLRRHPGVQIGFTVLLLIATECAYRFCAVRGFDQPFVKDHNFGVYMDMLMMGKINGDGWVAINFIPTTAHTMWGVLAGLLLRSHLGAARKILWLLTAGLIGIVAGYALDPVTPIIKRICTTSFVIVSGGWCLATLGLFYWVIDVIGLRRWAGFAVIVGMNSILIYLISQSVGPQWFNRTVGIWTRWLWARTGAEDTWLYVFNAAVVLMLEWLFCYWLYRKRVFVRI